MNADQRHAEPVDVHLILLREGAEGLEVLLSRRAGTVYATGLWHLPSGHLDGPHEDVVDALVRETREETRVVIDPEDVRGAVTVHHRSPGGASRTGYFFDVRHLLLVTGNETTVNLIGNGAYALLRHPDQLPALRADRSLMPGAVDELLRYESPVNTSSLRFTTEPIEVGGVVIPEGELVVVALTSANRDESQFPDAASLDIHRQTGANLSFGHGIHYCVGAQLARLEAQIAFDRLFDRFPHIRLAADPADLRWQPGTALRGLRSLPVSLGAEQG